MLSGVVETTRAGRTGIDARVELPDEPWGFGVPRPAIGKEVGGFADGGAADPP